MNSRSFAWGGKGLQALLAIACAAFCHGCRTTPLVPHRAVVSSPSGGNEEVYARQNLTFDRVRVWKPANPREGMEWTYAPIFVEEIGVDVSEPATLELASFSDVVLLPWSADEPRLYPRIAYTWNWPVRAGEKNMVQGIRMTLDSEGMPMLWEVLADSSGRQQIFVSQSLENAVERDVGKPLPGRRYSIEPGTNVTPHVLVPRILEDGPVPMGPVIYVAHNSGDITTVICRCMPSQASNVVQTSSYSLQPKAAAIWARESIVERLRWPQGPAGKK